MRRLFALGLVMALGCNGGGGGAVRAESGGGGGGRIESEAGGARYGMRLDKLERASPALLAQLKAATTANVDAPGLAPVAAEAIPDDALLKDSGKEGVIVAVSEPEATFSFDGHEPQPVRGRMGKDEVLRGWHLGGTYLSPGVHAIRVEKQGSFPVETQILVRPGVFEVVAVRLGKVVMRSGGFAK